MRFTGNEHQQFIQKNTMAHLKEEESSTDTGGLGPVLSAVYPETIDPYIDNRLRSNKPTTFLGFIDELRSLWQKAGHAADIVRAFPANKEAKYPTVTYRLKSRKVNPHFKDIKPRYRQTIRNPHRNGEYVEIFGQIFDLSIEFCVISPKGEEADELVILLEDFIQVYTGHFKMSGVQEILFDYQGEDETFDANKAQLSKRTLYYNVRFEKIVIRQMNQIEQIALQAKVRQPDGTQ